MSEEELKTLRLAIDQGKAVIGADRVKKMLRTGKVAQIYLASNCPEEMKADLMQLTQLSQTPVTQLALTNEDLGVFCKKNFFVTVIGLTQ